ncbi:hypothetical protein [Arthrobacter sp. G119Y2]|uniref:hypothetical protein n=1 Tax=Arthrobacter sp. G119Y2 TaxID=3134965 RepID=UPI00311948AA
MSSYYGTGYWQAKNAAGNAQIIQASQAADRATLLAQASRPADVSPATPTPADPNFPEGNR